MLASLRRTLRNKLMQAVDEAVQRRHQELTNQLERQHRELVELCRRQHREQLAAMRRQTDRTIDVVQRVETRSRRDLRAGADRQAVESSVRFAQEHMATAKTRPDPRATLEYALSLAPESGLALEFGVFSGQTLETVAHARAEREVYGFDSFEGLPEDWRTGFPAGTFDVDGLPEVPGAELVVGWFTDTLPGFLAAHPGPVAFLHVDSDLYSSARTVLENVGPRLRVGSVIVFDEYFNFPGWENHEHRAWQEYVAATGTGFAYEAYTSNNEQVVVRVTEIGRWANPSDTTTDPSTAASTTGRGSRDPGEEPADQTRE